MLFRSLKDFFGSVDHEKLLVLVARRVSDGRVLRLIEAMFAIDTKLQETATTYEDVYAEEPDGEWRIARARRLDLAG